MVRGMKNAILAFVIAGTLGFLILIGYAVRSLYFEFGAGMAFAGAACVFAFMLSMALLIDMRRTRVARLLEQIEVMHGVDLAAEKSRVADL